MAALMWTPCTIVACSWPSLLSEKMGAVSRLCKHFRFSGKNVGYAGTKDKRGVTSQWCTVKRKKIEELRTFNRPLGAFQVTYGCFNTRPRIAFASIISLHRCRSRVNQHAHRNPMPVVLSPA